MVFVNSVLTDFFSGLDISKDFFVMLKESEKDAIKLLMTAAQYSFELLQAKRNK